MGVFSKRPLAAACFALILSVLIGLVSELRVFVILTAAVCLLLAFFIVWRIRRGYSAARFFVVLIFLGVLTGIVRGYLGEHVEDHAVKEAVGTNQTAEIEVREVRHQSSVSSEYVVSIREWNGRRVGTRAILRCSFAAPYYIGDRLNGTFRAESLDFEAYGDAQQRTYRAEECAVILLCDADNAPALKASGTDRFPTRLADVRGELAARLAERLGGEAGELAGAMLFGTAKRLADAAVRDFRRSGVSHLLAISGLHLGILALLADRFLLLCRVDRKGRGGAVIFLCALYFVLSGGSFSTLRALLMLCAAYLAFLTHGDHDPLTALLAVGAGIVLIAPSAVFSLSFQMTMLATFGILAYAEIGKQLSRLFPRKKGIKGVLPYLCRIAVGSLFLTFSATVAVLPVQWFAFGSFSAITPVSNLLMVPLAAPFLLCSLLALLPAVGAIAAFPAAMIGRALLWIAAALSRLPAVVSLRYAFVPYILIPMLALSLILLCLPLRRRAWLCTVPFLAGVAAFAAALLVARHASAGTLTVLYRAKGNNEGLILQGGGETVLVDVSAGSKTQFSANWQYAEQACATEVSALMLTHYHRAHISAFSRFADTVLIRELLLPQPLNEAERDVFDALCAAAEERGITVTIFPHGQPVSLAGGTVLLSYPLYENRSTHPAFYLKIEKEDARVCYESGAYEEFARHAGAAIPNEARVLILGAHGPVPHEAAPIGGSADVVVIGDADADTALYREKMAQYIETPATFAVVLP